MASWRLTTDGVTFYSAFDIRVKKQLNGLNVITKVSSVGSGYVNGDVVRLINTSNNEVFRGIITNVQPPDSDDDIVEDFVVTELAIELKRKMIENGGLYSVTLAGSLGVSAILEALLGASGGTGWTHPDVDTTTFTGNVQFESMSVLDGIYKVCKDMRGVHVWFDNDTRDVRHGTYNTDRTGTPIINWLNKKTVIETASRDVDEVIVYGSSKSINGKYGTPNGTTVAYQLRYLPNADECVLVAEKILGQLTNEKKQIRIVLPYTSTYNEGDLVRVGVDVTDYVIHEVVFTEFETWLSIGSASANIFDAQPMVGVNEGDDTEGALDTILSNDKAANEDIGWDTLNSFVRSLGNLVSTTYTSGGEPAFEHYNLAGVNTQFGDLVPTGYHLGDDEYGHIQVISLPYGTQEANADRLYYSLETNSYYVNTNTLTNHRWRHIGVPNLSSEPSSDAGHDNTGENGNLYYNTTSKILFQNDGTYSSPNWVAVGGGDFLANGTVPMTGNLTFNKVDPAINFSEDGSNIMGRIYGTTPTTGSITAIADGGGGEITLTSTAHGKVAGDKIIISGTTDYDGLFVVISVTTNTINIAEVYTSSQTGDWYTSSMVLISEIGDLYISTAATLGGNIYLEPEDGLVDVDGTLNADQVTTNLGTSGGVVLDGNATTPATKIQENSGNMEFSIAAGKVFIFKVG